MSANLSPADPTHSRFCRHIVTIMAHTSADPSTDVSHTNASGFVIEFGSRQWLVTAGHMIDGDDGLRAIKNAGYLCGIFLCDAWVGPDGKGGTVVLPVGSLDDFRVLGTNEKPPDIAILQLDTVTATALERGQN